MFCNMLDARDLPDGQRLTTDVCIIGAGAAGITMALDLIGTGIDVLLLESGDVKDSREAQDLNAGVVVDERLHPPPGQYRRRRFGGSMNARETRCTPIAAFDLEARSYVPNSGWPITAETLAPFYPRALRLCESDDSARLYGRDAEVAQKPLIDGFDDADPAANFSAATLDRYGHNDDFGSRYADRLRAAGNVCVLLNLTVTRLQLNPAGTAVGSVLARTLAGSAIVITANHFVLAAGALETARLLLANRDVHPHGIGNDRDNVGRYYLCPLQGFVGGLHLTRPPTAIWYGNRDSEAGVRSRRRLVLKPASQDRLKIGSFVARLRPTRTSERERALDFLSRGRPMPSKAGVFGVEFQAEQQPNPSSRVSMSEDQDALGMPRLLVKWNCNVADFETVRRGMALLADDIQRTDAGNFAYDPSTLAGMMTCNGRHGVYQLGTTRMGSDPDSSVVDAHCRVHGVENLFVAGPSVFATSSQGDPMLTMVALTLRLTDHLKMLKFKVAPSQYGPAPRPESRPGKRAGSALEVAAQAVVAFPAR